jgi:SpoIID/LytB domain protein
VRKSSAPWIFRLWSALGIAGLVFAQSAAETAAQTATAQTATAQTATAQTANSNPVIQVGVVQRFGTAASDEMTIKPVEGDRLTLKFLNNGKEQTLVTANAVKVDVAAQPLAKPQLQEQVVLSTHRSFESAEDSANQWKARGIEVEIAQPRQWQVWAKRDVYKTPLLRRLLMQNLQAHGAKTAFFDSKRVSQATLVGFTVGENRYQRDQLVIDAGSDRVEVTFNDGEHGRRTYGGDFKLQPNAYGTYSLVNYVPIETYLRGVVPNEIGDSAPMPAIEAQAVLARTYALRNLRRFAIDNYQMCADTQCQVYYGLSGSAPNSDRAITATAGQVLTYQNELVDALYSSTTGGITAPFTNVWNGSDRPYLTAVIDSVNEVWDLAAKPLTEEKNFREFIAQKKGFNEETWDKFRWRENSSLAELSQDLKSYLSSKQNPQANFTQIQNIEVVERSPAGRVQRMAVTTDRGVIQLEKDEILRAFYAPSSTLFYIEPIYDSTIKAPKAVKSASPSPSVQKQQPTPVVKGYAFVGGGFGHGVGMSQTGAYNLGKLGWSGSRILSFYYPGTQLQMLNPAIVFWRQLSEAETQAAQ